MLLLCVYLFSASFKINSKSKIFNNFVSQNHKFYNKMSESKSKKKQSKDEIKREIALLSVKLVTKERQDTESNIQTLIKHCKNYKEKNTQKIAILSLAKVFIDILPNYVVDKHSDKDNPSKEVKERRKYESLLVKCSSQFVQICEKICFGESNDIKVRKAGAKALSLLYSNKPLFNLSKTLCNDLVRLSCNNNIELRQIACEQMEMVFQHDPMNKHTLDIMSKVATTPTNKVSLELLETLLNIKFKEIKEKSAAEKAQEKIQDKQLIKELKEADLFDKSEEIKETQIHILEHLFATAFRYLKETKSEKHFILSMEILRKYIKRINYDYVAPILTVLKQSRFSLRVATTSAQTARDLCASCDYHVDLRDYYVEVFARMYESLEDRDAVLDVLALVDILSGEIDKGRVFSFVKRLLILAIHSGSDVAATILCQLRQFLSQIPDMTMCLDFSDDSAGNFGLYLEDPDHANGRASKWWELAYFLNHRSQGVQIFAEEIAPLSTAAKVHESRIRAAKERIKFNPQETLEELDERTRLYDASLIQDIKHQRKSPEMKIFDF